MRKDEIYFCNCTRMFYQFLYLLMLTPINSITNIHIYTGLTMGQGQNRFTLLPRVQHFAIEYSFLRPRAGISLSFNTRQPL